DVEPWGLAFRGRAWRLVGRDPEKGQRVFLVERIARIEVNPQKPHTPDFEPPASFDAADAAARSSVPWLWEHHPPQPVRLRFAKGSEAIGERLFDAPEGSLTVTNLDGLVPQLLSLGDRVAVESPAAVQGKIRAALLRIQERLGSPPEPPAEAFTPARQDARAEPGRIAEPELKRERLRRLLLIVPAARRRPGVKLADLARDLGLDPQDLREDIDLLGLVGRPPFSPDDLIDITVDERDRVTVSLDQSFSRPPQLTPLEALALSAAAEEVAPADPAVHSALARLTGQLPPTARQLYAQLARRLVASTPAPRGARQILAQLRSAAERHREVALEYDKEGRGAAGERMLRPQGVIDHG